MLDFSRWKYALVALVMLFSILYALPNLYPQDPAVQINANRGSTVDAALKTRVQGLLDQDKIAYKAIAFEGKSLLVRLNNADSQIKAADLIRPALGNQFTVALNLASTVPSWLASIGGQTMRLGLDLQGGVHFLMEVDQKAALDKRENAYTDDLRIALRDAKIRYTSVNRTPQGIVVQLDSSEARESARALFAKDFPLLVFEDMSGGFALRGSITPAELKAITDGAIEQNVGTLRNRINELGVSEPIITRQGSSRIVVQLAGVQDTAQAKKLLGATATLEYRAQVDGDAFAAANNGSVPPEARVYYLREKGPGGERIPVLLSKRVIASGEQLVNASSGLDQQSGTPKVDVSLDNAGGARMFDFTTQSVGRGMGVVFIERVPEVKMIDGKEVRTVRISEEVISLANINGVFGKQFQTTGLGSMAEAAELALLLRAGALAAPVDIVEERVIGPSMGQENIEAGKQAVMIGFLAVCVLMIVYYKLFGLISVTALFANLALLLACLSVMGATLTMPGIAGIVLTLGMAIDGNVLICERIREEVRLGLSPLASIKAGYELAWHVILDSNVAKIIAAVALFSFGSGPVRGFAVVLFFGVLTSMFTSVTVSRALATLAYGHGRKPKSVSV